MNQNRLKSWALWVAVGSLVVFVAKQLWGLDIGGQVDGLLNALLPVLVGFGIINNPTSKNNI